MTQEQALTELQRLFPGVRGLGVGRERMIGEYGGHMNTFSLWHHDGPDYVFPQGLIQTHRSFDEALAVLKAGMESQWVEDDSPVEEEAKLAALGVTA